MAYIPPNAKWYLADVVERFTVEGDPRDVVHVNLVLIRADSPDEAYAKALAKGRASEARYANPAGREVRCQFLGLRDLNVIHEPLEDGAELAYSEHVAPSGEQIARLLRPRDALGVFAPGRGSTGPDYSDGEIVTEARALMQGSRGSDGNGEP